MADRLTIRAIETIPIRVPLTRTYQGSSYRMTHRSTIVTRIHTDEGVTGEAYAGDEESDLPGNERDIKPENAGVGVGSRRDRTRLVLYDFSLSRAPLTEIHAGTRGFWVREAWT